MKNLLKLSTQRLSSLLSIVCSKDHNDKSSKSIFNLVDKYTDVMSHYVKHNGEHYTINLFKQVHLIAVKLAMGRPFKPLQFVRSDRKDIPRILLPFVPFLLGTPEEKRIALSITKLYLSLKCTPDRNVESITRPFQGRLLGPSWHNFLPKWIKSTKGVHRISDLGWDGNWRSTTKMGPNGHALLASHVDSCALLQNSEDRERLFKWLDITNQVPLKNKIISIMNSHVRLTHQQDFLPGRLGFIPEGGGKTRQIAIPDFYTQESLKSLFKGLMEILRGMEQDGTYNQSVLANSMKDAALSLKPIHCFDLSSATDRFPVKIQENVLKHLIGQNKAEAWRKLLSKRHFWSGSKYVAYGCGQPMGVLSSWAAFAVTHHAIVGYAASRVGESDFRDYVILGDDIAIFNTRVASNYEQLMNQLGVSISPVKSFHWTQNDPYLPSGEVAKRLFIGGHEITPIPYDLLHVFLQDPVSEIVTFRHSVTNLGLRLEPTTLLNLSNSIVRRRLRRKFLTNALAPNALFSLGSNSVSTDPIDSKARLYGLAPGYHFGIPDNQNPWEGLDLSQIPKLLVEQLIKKFDECKGRYWSILSELSEESFWKRRDTLPGCPLNIKDGDLAPIHVANTVHPVVDVINNKLVGLNQAEHRLSLLQAAEDWITELREYPTTWSEVQELDWNLEETFVPKRSKIAKVQASTILATHKALPRLRRPDLEKSDRMLLLTTLVPITGRER